MEIVPLFPADKLVSFLDIGCGNGSLLAAAKAKGYQNVKGIDISEEQVELAHRLGVPEVIQGNLNELIASGKETFDLITGMDIIEHFSKDELTEMLTGLKKILKPGGVVIFRTPNMDAPYASVFASGDFTHECLLNKSSAMQLMNACGYSRTEVFAGMIKTRGFIKETIRKIVWSLVSLKIKIWLFASGRTWHEVLFSPNLIIKSRL